MRKRFGFGWMELITGVLLIALGIFTFVRPDGILTGIVVIYGVSAVVVGVEDIVLYSRVSRFTGFGPVLSLISGVMSVMCGIMLLAYPGAGSWALTLLFPIWFIAHCISGIVRMGSAWLTRRGFLYYFLLTLYAVGVLLGFVMIFSPALAFLTMRMTGYVVAVYLVLFGVENVAEAFAGRRRGW